MRVILIEPAGSKGNIFRLTNEGFLFAEARLEKLKEKGFDKYARTWQLSGLGRNNQGSFGEKIRIDEAGKYYNAQGEFYFRLELLWEDDNSVIWRKVQLTSERPAHSIEILRKIKDPVIVMEAASSLVGTDTLGYELTYS